MNKLILIAMIIGCTLIADESLDKLEQSYLSKAETLQADSDKDVKERDAKLAKDSKRLAAAYLKSLKKIEIAIVQKGDLDGALKVRAKIKEIEAILKGEAVAVVKTAPNSALNTALIGKWFHINARHIYNFEKTGVITNNVGNSGVWRQVGDSVLTIKWNHVSYTQTYILSKNSKQLLTNGKVWANKVTALKTSTDPIVGKWQWIGGTTTKPRITIYYANGTLTGDNGITKGKWSKKQNGYFTEWPSVKSLYTLSADGNTLKKGNTVVGRKATGN